MLMPYVNFLPTEPRAVKYEMIRSFGEPYAERKYEYYWFDLGVVEGKFVTDFLLYLNDTVLGRTSDATKCIKNVIRLINKRTISRRETCLHLPGWNHCRRANVNLAVECFKQLIMQPAFGFVAFKVMDDIFSRSY